MKEGRNGTFKFEKKKVFLTYKGHIEKEKMLEFIGTFAEVQKFICAHEHGDTGYDHTHVAILWAKIVRKQGSDAARCFDYEGIHPNITAIGNKKSDWKAVVKYCRKDDKEPLCVGLDEEDEDELDAIVNAQNKLEAIRIAGLKYATQASLVYDISRSGGEHDHVEAFEYPEWYFKHVDPYVRSSEPRKLLWIFDKVGNTGKTMTALKMWHEDPKHVYYVSQFGGGKNAATIIQNAVENGWEPGVLIADMPRQAEEWDIYNPLEQILNGAITATKYVGRTVKFRPAKVIVFANFPPNMEAMSADRWLIRDITRS